MRVLANLLRFAGFHYVALVLLPLSHLPVLVSSLSRARYLFQGFAGTFLDLPGIAGIFQDLENASFSSKALLVF